MSSHIIFISDSDIFVFNSEKFVIRFSYSRRILGTKKLDVHEYHIDTFVMGDDWKGQFDFLEDEGVEVVYLPRTPEISTTQIKKDLNK
ncbi:Glycerol-3-phosphate cytidylyltransferase [Streptococcus thermophilus]|nr:Glycerol-3-phosphate cytidylyltransferase [Streptococcus thermophilus]